MGTGAEQYLVNENISLLPSLLVSSCLLGASFVTTFTHISGVVFQLHFFPCPVGLDALLFPGFGPVTVLL